VNAKILHFYVDSVKLMIKSSCTDECILNVLVCCHCLFRNTRRGQNWGR